MAKKTSNKMQISVYRINEGQQYDHENWDGASVLTELNEKHSKIKGLRLSIISNNSKIKYFSSSKML